MRICISALIAAEGYVDKWGETGEGGREYGEEKVGGVVHSLD
jgi:hypothetical protein